MAVLHFVRKKVDYAVFEVGLGGTYDATNFEQGFMSIITRIDVDHTDILGEDVKKIAWEKCNIIKEGQTVVTTEENRDVMDVINDSAAGKGARLIIAGPSPYPVSLKGAFQEENAGIAVSAARELSVDDKTIKEALLSVNWPGRIEKLGPNVLLDCAHNLSGIRALRKHVESLSFRKLIILFAVSRNKKYKEMLESLPKYEELVFTQTSVTRRLPIEEVPADLDCKKIRDPVDALAYAKSRAGKDDLVLVCGSIFLVADIKTAFERVKP